MGAASMLLADALCKRQQPWKAKENFTKTGEVRHFIRLYSFVFQVLIIDSIFN